MLTELSSQCRDEFPRRQIPMERRALPCPLRAIAGLVRRFRCNLRAQHREPIPETACGASRYCARHDCVMCRIAGQGLAVSRICIRLGTGDEGRAELRGARAQPQHCGNPSAIHDSARRDYRHIEIANQ